METTVLLLHFVDEVGGKFTIQIEDPDQHEIDSEKVKQVMDTVISKDVFQTSKGYKLVEPHSAQVVIRTVNDLGLE